MGGAESSPIASGLHEINGLSDVVDGLPAHARQRLEPAVVDGRFQILDRFDLRLLPKTSNRLRTEPRYLHDFAKTIRHRCAELLQLRDGSLRGELDDLLSARLSDAVDRFQ